MPRWDQGNNCDSRGEQQGHGDQWGSHESFSLSILSSVLRSSQPSLVCLQVSLHGLCCGVHSVCERCSVYCDCDAGSTVVLSTDIGCWCCGKACELLSVTLNSTQELDLGSGRQERRGHVVVEVDVLVGSTGCCQCSTGRSDFATTLMVLALSLNLCLSVNKVVMKGIHIVILSHLQLIPFSVHNGHLICCLSKVENIRIFQTPNQLQAW